jgi:hypothetical protein
VKHLATITAAVALALGVAVPAGARAPANQTGCEQFGSYALAVTGFHIGEQAVADKGNDARFVQPTRHSYGMIRCMAVDYNAGVAYARGTRAMPLPVLGKRQPAYIGAAYAVGLAQR